MFLIYLDERVSEARSEAEIKAGMALHAPYIERLRRNGQYAGSDALEPGRAARTLRTLQNSGGKPVATEGPFAESREQFGGFYLVEAKHLDEAIALASQCPALQTVGTGIEIRPIPTAASTDPQPTTSQPAGQRRYLLAIYRDDAADHAANDAADDAKHDLARRAAFLAWAPYVERLRAAGRFAGGDPLAPAGSATSLRLRDGKAVLTDGPFEERPVQLAGYCVVWARDIDEAVALAADCPDARQHAIEVRPIRSAGA